jgi:hypothetical protein
MTTMTDHVSAAPAGSPASATAAADSAAAGRAKGGLLERYLNLPNWQRLALAAVVLVGLWIFANDFPWQWAADLNAESSRIERALSEGADRETMVKVAGDVPQAIVAIGPIAVPRAENDGSQELARTVNEVMAEAGVKQYSLDVRPGGKVPPNMLEQLVRSEGGGAAGSSRVEKLTGELKFEVAQDTAIRIVAALEGRPEIESISRLRMSRKDADKKVTVDLTLEAWVQVARRKRGGA